MRKFVVAAILALVAVVVAPIASASAEKFNGTCKVEGKAQFEPGLVFEELREATYKFEPKEVKAKRLKLRAGFTAECEGTGTDSKSPPVSETGSYTEWEVKKAEVTGGKGKLECGTATKDGPEDNTWKGAKATIEVRKILPVVGKTFKAESYFRFKTAVVGTTKVLGEIEVELESTKGGGGNTAVGRANFDEPVTEEVANCLTPTGAGELPFETAETAASEELRKAKGEALKPFLKGTVGA
jgi:hypothetical protein